MGGISIILYVIMNYISAGTVIADAVSALGVMIAFYYGLTGFTCAWYYRKTLGQSARNLWLRGILPVVGALMLYGAMGYNLWYYWRPTNSFTTWHMSFWPHWNIGGVFLIDIIALAIGVVLMFTYAAIRPPFFRGEVLNRDTPTMVPEDIGTPVGLFGVDPNT
jgi:hypothetical protein